MELLIWTNNPAKLEYFNHLLAKLDINIKTPAELSILGTPKETGQSEIENSLQKAKFFYKQSGGVTSFSDDAGMHIDALNGDPGLKVRRWKDELSNEINDQDWLTFFLEKTKHIPLEKRTGSFTIGRVIYAGLDKIFTQSWERKFTFNDKPDSNKFKPGWPMSSITTEIWLNKSWWELSLEEKLNYEKKNIQEISHWLKTLK